MTAVADHLDRFTSVVPAGPVPAVQLARAEADAASERDRAEALADTNAALRAEVASLSSDLTAAVEEVRELHARLAEARKDANETRTARADTLAAHRLLLEELGLAGPENLPGQMSLLADGHGHPFYAARHRSKSGRMRTTVIPAALLRTLEAYGRAFAQFAGHDAEEVRAARRGATVLAYAHSFTKTRTEALLASARHNTLNPEPADAEDGS